MNTRALTLIEVLITLLVLGIALSLGLPLMASASDTTRMDAAATEVVTLIHYAQDLARQRGVETRMLCDTAKATIHLELLDQSRIVAELDRGKNTAATASLEDGPNHLDVPHPILPNTTYELHFANADNPYPVRLVSAVFGDDAVLTFDAEGSPDTGGNIVLVRGPLRREITVAPVTARTFISP